jgi:UPF0755 protein
MSTDRRSDDGTTERRTSNVQPRSPSEALEPTRGPVRPSGPRRRRARKLSPWLRFLNTMLTFTAIGLLLFGGGAFWVTSELNKDGPLKEARNVVVPRGEGAHEIAKRLETDGVIASQQMFVGNYLARYVASWFGGQSLQIKAG